MKNPLRIFFFALAMLSFSFTVKAQVFPAEIVGPFTVCVGECATYEVVIDSVEIAFAQWQVSVNGTSLPGLDGNPVTICFAEPGVYFIGVSGFTVDQNVFEAEIVVETIGSAAPVIVSTSALCPTDSIGGTGACEKICAFNTATYEATGIPPGTTVDWEVLGAESFTPNGNTVTVEWGAPGQGEVIASVGGSAPPSDPFQIFCGQSEIVDLPNGGIGGNGYVSIWGSTGPYEITLSWWNGFVTQTVPTPGHYTFDFLLEGIYFVTVTDAAGNVLNCTFEIVVNPDQCYLSALPEELVHASDCNGCDGAIFVDVLGNLATYTFEWSNGSTTPNLTGLCPGTYSLTLTDDIGCTTVETFIIACPSDPTTCSGEASLCVEILEEPVAAIGSLPPAANGGIEICQGQTVFFENLSLNATSYIWDFGDLNTSAQYEPSHTYPTAGTYTVSLIARNECFCADTTTVEVNVIAADVPEINCVGTLCEGETATYSTDAMCSNYNWVISGNGNILDGGGPTDNFVTVEWLSGPEGTVSLDVSGCAGTVCNLPNVVPIPIISDAVQIIGPDKVCEGSTEEYYIPNYQGTDINWSVIGSGNIVDGWDSERITVNWWGDAGIGNPQRVIVEFENCYLGCGGRDTLEVNIVPSFYIAGPIEVCENSTTDYQSFNTITGALMNSNWEVFDASGTSLWTSGGATNTASIPWSFPAGSYIVRATSANASGFCNDDYQVFVKIIAGPPPVASIDGEDEICPGETYTYSANGNPPNDYTWTVTGGTPTTVNGSPANVTWDATGPYSLSVIQIATTGLACESDPISLAVGPIPSFTVTGDDQVCREELGNYSVPFFENIDYQWVVNPSGAGTIVSGQGTENVEVQWYEAGNNTVSVTICGAIENFNVNVLTLPEPVVDPASVCQGDLATVMTTQPFSTYVWKEQDGSQFSTAASVDIGSGYYEVEVTDANGCFGDTTFQVTSLPSPYVTVSTPAYPAICPGSPPVTLYALASSGGYDYEWFHDGSPTGGNTPTLTTTLPGNYQVVVTNASGCTDAASINLLDCETVGGTCVNGICTGLGGGLPTPGCTPLGSVDFSFTQTSDCNIFDFQSTAVNAIPGSHQWYFDDPASGMNTSNLPNPSHTFSAPGYYTVIHVVSVPAQGGGACPIGIFYDVLVPAAANFGNSPACPNAPVSFNDLSTFVAGASITGWDWDFGDPGSGAANTSTAQNPTHTYDTDGTFSVTLTITMASGCQTSITQNVLVNPAPTVNFLVPDQTCEQTALPFDAMLSADYASLWWNFGDPASGTSNQSEVENTFHAFSSAGNYTVTLSASNIFGCTASFDDVVPVTANTLAGNINFSQPPPICEGDSVVLTAPVGGTAWQWSNGNPTNEITVFESGVYGLTITDDEGCVYAPPDAIVEVVAEPNAIIKVVEYNDFGQPVAFFEDSYTTCEGEDVFLIVQGNTNYTYQWSSGEPGDELSFTEDKGNLLSVGTHDFTVTVTDGLTGCTSVEGPMTVIVNPTPDVEIESTPTGFLCENQQATLSVVSPDPMLTYGWNTGEAGTSIDVIAGGTYFVQAVNQFGCKGRSNEIELNNAPDIDLIPTGCLTRCEPDTMCLPNTPSIVGYQWFLDGVPMAAPNGTLAEPIFDQSGEYTVQLTDWFGCTSTSAPLNLDLQPGFGDILGNVWYDVNGNGVIDAPDTLLSGIDIILNDGAVNLDTVTSSIGSGYIFVGAGANSYTLQLDTTSLPPGWTAYWLNGNLDLIGCDVEEGFDWLVVGCIPSVEILPMQACAGDGVTFDGVFIPAGTSQDFTYQSFNGCDSTITVEVAALTVDVVPLEFEICENESIDYDGVTLFPGDQQDFVFTNLNGCDSTVQVSVVGLPTSAEALQINTCPGSVVTYQGTPLSPGDIQDFTFANFNGCDSVVTVSVVAAPPDTTQLELETCEGTTVDYAGFTFSPGDQQDVVLQDDAGCDSIVQVTVAGLPNTASALQLESCPGVPVTYQGAALFVGDVQDFTLQNFDGCDSTVTVSVVAAQIDTTQLELEACEGTTVDYAGFTFSPGDQQDVVLQDADGCDSVVQVMVVGLPTYHFVLFVTACEGETVDFNGTTLLAGDEEDFVFQSADGCDSTITVTVLTSPSDTVAVSLEVCEGEIIEFHGQELEAGEQGMATLTNQFGCDSIVIADVVALPSVNFDLTANEICWNASDGSVEVSNVSGSTSPYLVSLDGQNFQTDLTFDNLAAGPYTVYVQDGNDCVFENQIELPAIQPIIVETEDETMSCGDVVTLNPLVVSELPVTWLWPDGSDEPTYSVESPGTYLVQVTNDCETAQGTFEISLDPTDRASRIYMPNSFSPNGDGVNDCYRGFVAPHVEVDYFLLRIFDRWGNQMFESNNPEECWDGYFRGKQMDTAVFTWFIEMRIRNCDGELIDHFEEGGIHLLR